MHEGAAGHVKRVSLEGEGGEAQRRYDTGEETRLERGGGRGEGEGRGEGGGQRTRGRDVSGEERVFSIWRRGGDEGDGR